MPVFGCAIGQEGMVVSVGFRSQSSSLVYFSEEAMKLSLHMYMDVLCLYD